MATTDEKKIIEIVVKTTGAADIKKLASELAAMRKEAKTTRTEIQQTNSTLNGFGSTFKTVAKAFAGGLALKNLVQSSEVMQDLTQNVRDLAGSFIDAAAEASGFAETMDDDFWMTAQQGAKDLGRALGDLWKDAKEISHDSTILVGLDNWFRKWTSIGRQIEWVNRKWKEYRDNAKFDAPTLGAGAMTAMLGDVSRLSGGASDLQKRLDADTKAIGEVLRNRRELADRMTEEARAQADFQRYSAEVRRDNARRREQAALEGPQGPHTNLDTGLPFTPLQFDLDEIGESLKEGIEYSREFQEGWAQIEDMTLSWDEGLKKAIEHMKYLNELQGDLAKQSLEWGESLQYAFKGVLTRDLHNTRDLLRSILNDMRSFYAELAARAAAAEVLGWVQKGIRVVGAAVGSGGASSGGVASWNMIAKGGVFNQGNLIPMASGGIVSRPTLFPMANGMGLMGEAGPEAVMPLKRGRDGKLGIASGRSNVVIENHGQPVTANVISSEEETRIVLRAATMGAEIAQAQVNRSVTSGHGQTAQSFQRAYGLRRRV